MDMLQDIIANDPDRVLKQAMASKQVPNTVRQKAVPRTSTVIPDQTIINDNMSESNFSCQTGPPLDFQSQQTDPVFKVPTVVQNSRMKKELVKEFNSICKQIERMPSQTADYYYDVFLKRIKSFHLRVTADVLDQSTSQFTAPNNVFMNTMMDCNASVSQCSNPRSFTGFQGSAVCNMLNESIRSANTLLNGTRSQVVSSTTTTFTPPENVNGGTFLVPKPPMMKPPNPKVSPLTQSNLNVQENIRSAEMGASTSQAGGGSFFARPSEVAPPSACNKSVENLRRSKDSNSSPATKSANNTVKNSPMSMNNTMNSTVNKSCAVNKTSVQRRMSNSSEITLKNWTLCLSRSFKTKKFELRLRGTLAKKCDVGSPNRVHESQGISSRISDWCVRTEDAKVYHLQGYFQNSNHSNVPQYITSIYLKKKTFPSHWRKMLITWSSLRAGSKAAGEKDVSQDSMQDSPLNSTMTRLKTKQREKVRKPMSPLNTPAVKANSRSSISPAKKQKVSPAKKQKVSPAKKQKVSPAKKPAVNTVSRPAVHPVSRPVVNPVSRPFVPVSRPVVNHVSKQKVNRDIKLTTHKHAPARKKYDSSVVDSSFNSPVEVRPKKKVCQPASSAIDSSANSFIEVRRKKKGKPNPKYWNENDISLSETDRSHANFADSSDVSFKIVSPGKALNSIKKLKDSNIINSQITPPTAYFLNVMSKSSEKKKEKIIETPKKSLKRLTSRVLKKGKTSSNVQNIGQRISVKDPKAIKRFIQESEVRLSKIPSQSKSQMEDEMSDFSDLPDDVYSDD